MKKITLGRSDGLSLKEVEEIESSKRGRTGSTFAHINPEKGIITSNNFSPIVVMKKVKLGRSDGLSLKEALPELEDTDEPQDLESQQIQNNVSHEASKSVVDDVAFINTMTLEELNVHVQQCLEMSTENKITQKNAFALRLIDCLSILMKAKKDFSTMACTLDAGAKIYSFRVDALHQQVMKLAEEVFQRIRSSGKDDAGNEGEGLSRGKTAIQNRRTNQKSVIAARETLCRQLKGNDPRDKYIKVEAQPGAILSRARRDPRDLSLSLDLKAPFWRSRSGSDPLRAEGTVTLPEIKIIREKSLCEGVQCSPKCVCDKTLATPLFDTNDNVLTDADVAESSSQGYVSIVDFHTSDPLSQEEPNIGQFENPRENEPEDNQDAVDEVDIIVTAMERLKKETETGGAVNKVPSRLDAMKILFSNVGEYDYLNMRNKNYWAGPGFWKRPHNRLQNDVNKRKIKRKKREPGEVVYACDDFSVDKRWNQIFKKGYNLGKRTVMNWKKVKNTLPVDLKTEVTMFIDLFHMSTCREQDEKKSKDESSFEMVDLLEACSDSIRGQDVMNSSDSQDSLNDSFYQGAPGHSVSRSSDDRDTLNSAFYDVGMLPPAAQPAGSCGKVVRVEITSENTQDFGESSLVPAPKMVKFKPIQYSTKPIRVDMFHLKQSMMGIIEEKIEENDRKKNTDKHIGPVASSSTLRPETKFSDILKTLPDRLERTTAEDTSPAIAFMALLTLANENNLRLQNTENYEDVVVKFDDNPTDEPRGETGSENTMMDMD